MKKQYFTVNESIFSRRVHVFLNHSSQEVNSLLKCEQEVKNNDANFCGYSFIITRADGVTEYGIQVKEFNWTINEQGTLIHEIVHTVIKIWNANNIPYTFDNQEFLAHSISNLYVDIAAKIFNLKKKKLKPI